MRVSLVVLAAAGLAMAAPSHAGPSADVNAQSFYTTAVELQGKGMRAMFDSRAKTMRKQMEDAGLSARAANAAAGERGSPLFCVPNAARKKGLNVEQVIAMLGSLGQPTRSRLSLREAWLEALKRRYPCS